jgi:hypothetical protein
MQNAIQDENKLKSELTTPYYMFKFSIRSELTRKYYERRIRRFFDFIEFNADKDIEQRCNEFAEKSRNDVSWALNKIIIFLQFQKERTVKGEITAATLSNFVKAIKLFCDMSDVAIPWKKITRGLPRANQSANDRAPGINEIKKLIEYPDRRIKPIIYTMVSSGIRIGAWDTLQWKHISPITNDSGIVICAKIIVYPGDSEEYYSFITPECKQAIDSYLDMRSRYGEKLNGDSFLIRELLWNQILVIKSELFNI